MDLENIFIKMIQHMKVNEKTINKMGIINFNYKLKKNNLFILNSFGKEIWSDNSYYEGQYAEGKKNGKGKFVWTDGS